MYKSLLIVTQNKSVVKGFLSAFPVGVFHQFPADADQVGGSFGEQSLSF